MKVLTIVTTVIVLACSSSFGGVIYTWTGADDTDWDNTANWSGGTKPVDSVVGGNLDFADMTDLIVFDGSNMPLTNIPQLGSTDTPPVSLKKGGSLSLALTQGFWVPAAGGPYTVLTVGDGVSGGTEEVTLNLTTQYIARDYDSQIFVNSDGTLNLTRTDLWSISLNRYTLLNIDGGAVNSATFLDNFGDDGGTPYVDNKINFLSEGGSFTALYGGEYVDFSAIQTAVSDGINFTTTTDRIEITDNNGTSFTLTAINIPEPSTLATMILGGLICLYARKRQL